MKIPKRFIRPGMTAEQIKRVVEFVNEHRNELRKAPTFDTTEAAVAAAAKMYKKDELSLPSVWKEPEDIGQKFAVVHMANREDADIGGYTQVVDTQAIVDKAIGNIRNHDQINEV